MFRACYSNKLNRIANFNFWQDFSFTVILHDMLMFDVLSRTQLSWDIQGIEVT